MTKKIERTLYEELLEPMLDIKQMLFVSGPRQAGKTTFIKQLTKRFPNQTYLNWDIASDRKKILTDPDFFHQIQRQDQSKPAVIFDEIHKKTKWKNYLKNCYDGFSENYKFFCTGSGRLDLFQKGSDSLAGRYFLYHLWPFTVAELAKSRRNATDFFCDPLVTNWQNSEPQNAAKIWHRLYTKSGFPDPYLSNVPAFHRQWQNNYQNQLLREDIPNLSKIEKIDQLETLMYLLPSKVGNPISMNNIAQDIGVAFETIKSWLMLFEKMFLVFRIKPWSSKIPRAVTKEQKLYLFDYTLIENEANRFENMVALELWRAIHCWNENGLGKFNLNFARNRNEAEVDFVITNKNKPWLLIETKLSDDTLPKSLRLIQTALQVPAIQLVHRPIPPRETRNGQHRLLVCSASMWLAGLP